MKKIGIYSPYLDSFGGGERYMLTIAEILSANSNNQVDLLLDFHLMSLNRAELISNLGKHFSLNLSKVHLLEAPLGKGSHPINRLLFFKRYDLLFYLTDGSIFYSTAKRNILHFQFPLSEGKKLSFIRNTLADSLWGTIKLSSWDSAIYNSEFTKQHIESLWRVKGNVIYPPVDISKIKPLKKKKQIISVGRFFGFLKPKKQEEMIGVFKDLESLKETSGWSLHLAGTALEGDKEYLEELKRLASGHEIFFYPNVSFAQLVKLYGESSIYWHAAGYKEDDPHKLEHFGITTVEAMAGGCVPVVINKGGQSEIVEHGTSGFLWNNLEELIDQTLKLISDNKLRGKLSNNARLRSALFSKDRFKREVENLIK